MNIEPWGTIKTGSTHVAVKGAQHLLRHRGAQIAADGSFGAKTKAAVIAFQKSKGLTADGVVGSLTWGALVVPTGPGSTGEAVKGVQSFGLPRWVDDEVLVVDGVYGPTTADHVEVFQGSWGLLRDGKAGRSTWSFLSTSPSQQVWPLVMVGARQETNWCTLAAQHLLRHHGKKIAADGVFGPKSGNAIREFQMTLRATEIGTTVGQLDWPALVVTVKQGSTGEAVRAVQTLLPGVTVDGTFGPKTKAAVIEQQQMFMEGAPTGVVDTATWNMLAVPKFD